MTKKPLTPGAALAAMRKRHTIICADCGVAVEAVGPRIRCDRCRNRAAVQRYRAQSTGTLRNESSEGEEEKAALAREEFIFAVEVLARHAIGEPVAADLLQRCAWVAVASPHRRASVGWPPAPEDLTKGMERHVDRETLEKWLASGLRQLRGKK